MRRFVQRLCVTLAFTCICIWPQAKAQDASPTGAQQTIDSPNEWDNIKQDCFSFTFRTFGDCLDTAFTGQPVHIAVGSMAPQNGFAAGLAFVGSKNTDNWRNTWDLDAVGSNNQSWRAGIYFNFIHSGRRLIGYHRGTTESDKNVKLPPEYSVLNLYAEATSLNKLTYFGLGPNSNEAARSFYGMRQIIVGGDGVKPLNDRLRMTLYGELNGRIVSLRASNGHASPSIEQLYDETTAPGLTEQPSYLQFGEGLRMTPVFGDGRFRLNNKVAYQQYVAPANSSFSFQRLTVDLDIQSALYKKTSFFSPRPGNGPDSCSDDPGKDSSCPSAFTRNREGTIELRLLTELSMTPGGNIVPFYFQPTSGGSDIDGNPTLPSYQDYRFRDPNIILLHQGFEHSIFRLPVGFVLGADEGKLGFTRGDLGSSPWLHSFSTGLTVRAGGFPEVWLLFAWGGNEGTHTTGRVNTSLLGGTPRPSLL